MPDILSKFQKDPSLTFPVILLTHTDRQTNKNRQKHNLFGGGNKTFLVIKVVCSADIYYRLKDERQKNFKDKTYTRPEGRSSNIKLQGLSAVVKV